jgi:hypothetical protein
VDSLSHSNIGALRLFVQSEAPILRESDPLYWREKASFQRDLTL